VYAIICDESLLELFDFAGRGVALPDGLVMQLLDVGAGSGHGPLGHRVFVTRWGGSVIDLTMLDGPQGVVEGMLALQASQGEVPSRGSWPAVTAEGALLVDIPRRQASFFTLGDEGDLRLGYRRALLAAIGQAWTGWTVTWADDEAAGLAACLGLPLPGEAPRAWKIPPDAQHQPRRALDVTLRPIVSGQDELAVDAWRCGLLTVRKQEGTEGWLATASYERSRVHLAWLGEHLAARLPEPRQLPALNEPPGHGLHVDVAGREVGAWTAATVPGLRASLGRLWPGWQVTWWDDRIEEQLARCDDAALGVPPVDVASGFEQLAARARWRGKSLEEYSWFARFITAWQAARDSDGQ
jgi:hypothetical protein